MLNFFALLFAGMLQGVMLSLNGALGGFYSTMFAVSFFTHAIALVLLLAFLALRRQKIRFFGAPWYVYLVGVLGLSIVSISSICALKIGAAATLAISVGGELITARIVDGLGLFGMPKTPFDAKRIPGYALVVAGMVLVVLS